MMYVTLTLQLVTLLYHQLTTRTDLFPYNGIRYCSMKERFRESFVNWALMVMCIFLTLTKDRFFIEVGIFIWMFLFMKALLKWWVPYFTGLILYKMPTNETWAQRYERIFAKTIIILPPIKKHPIPNLEQMVLHLFMVATVMASWVYALEV